MGWDEILTPTMPTTAVIHSWRGVNEGLKESTLIDAAKRDYQSVLSNGYYIDRMLSVKHHYSVDPIGDAKLTKEEQARILGGEATMWSELVTSLTIDSRIWPRTAAIAERFWSSKSVTAIKNMQKRLKVVNYQLEELGLTHLKNKNVILRNLTHNQNVESLNILSNISEPLKIYTRNKGGTEYKSFSPFTLFADACTADASDAETFNQLTSQYLKNPTYNGKEKILIFFNQWIQGYTQFTALKSNTKIKKLAPLYKELNTVSKLFLESFKQPSKKKKNQISNSIKSLKQPCEDVEIVIIESLKRLNTFLN